MQHDLRLKNQKKLMQRERILSDSWGLRLWYRLRYV